MCIGSMKLQIQGLFIRKYVDQIFIMWSRNISAPWHFSCTNIIVIPSFDLQINKF